MDSAYEYNRIRNRYINLRSAINNTVSYIDQAIESLNTSSTNLGSNYLINNEPAGKSKIQRIENDLVQKRKDLVNYVLPAIENNIKKYKKLIEEAELAN